MAISGRKPKPVEQRRREGNPGKRRAPEPVLVAGRPGPEELAEPPAHLPDHAKEFWREAVVRLAEVGILDRVDMATLELMATQYQRVREAGEVIAREGPISKCYNGQPVVSPAVMIERQAANMFLKYAEHFALTPVARTRLGLAELERRKLADDVQQTLGKPNLKRVNGDGLANNRKGTESDNGD